MPTRSRKPTRRSGCPIGISLDIFGDRWSLLLVRDLMFSGPRRYKEFAAEPEAIASNILADRLQRLQECGIVRGVPDPEDGRRTIYHLTAKGMALAPLLVDMVVWAARHEDTDAPPAAVRRMERHRDEVLAELRARWTATEPHESEGRKRSRKRR